MPSPVRGTRQVYLRSVAGRRHQQRVRKLEPGHRPPAAPPRAPPRREARNELKPPPAFRITARRTKLRRPRPGAVGDLDPDDAVPGNDRDRNRLPRSTRAAMPDRITEDLAHQQDRHIPRTGAPARAPQRRTCGRPAPAPPAGKRHALPDRPPSHHRTCSTPGRPAPGNRPGSGRTQGNARSAPPRTSSPVHRPPRTPSVDSSVPAAPVRGRPRKADGSPHRSQAPIPVRYASVDTATQRPTAWTPELKLVVSIVPTLRIGWLVPGRAAVFVRVVREVMPAARQRERPGAWGPR